MAQFAEALDVIYDFFRCDSVDFAGEHYRVDAMEALPRCVQEPNPPILVGARGPRMLALAGSRADIVGVQVGIESEPADLTASSVAAKIELVNRAAADAGRAAPRIQFSCLHVRVTDSDEPSRYRSPFADVIEAQLDSLRESPVVLVGTAAECAAKIHDCAARFGISYWHLGQDVDAVSRIVERAR